MSNLFSLNGKVAIVTGAASGIGAGIAQGLASGGATVVIADVNEDAGEALAGTLKKNGGRAKFEKLDVSSESDWNKVVDGTVEEFGGLDVLVNNAGIHLAGPLDTYTLSDVQRVNSINVDSIFLGMKAASTVMKPGGSVGKGGSIINISSIVSIVGSAGQAAYAASKGAVKGYSLNAAIEFAQMGYGIRVNCVHPGVINTAMGGDGLLDEFVQSGAAPDRDSALEMINQMIPLGRRGEPEDIANLVHFLASDASAYCTGADFVVDGGLSAS